jgi:AcrR family transcriptional regulator
MSNAPRQGLNPRQAETVERLMVAGARELDEVGHEALTIRTVATRAGVSPATAYTYLASKNHLFAELFWQHLAADRDHPVTGSTPTERLQSVTRRLALLMAEQPALSAAVTPALLSSDPDVDRLRLRIGGELVHRLQSALVTDERPDIHPDVLETVSLAFSGALLQAGMGLMTYTEMGQRLDAVVATILKGNP